jgi:xylulokinase
MTLIGIDIGSSFIKGGVLDLDDLSIRGIVREPFPEPIAGLPGGHFEIDPHAVVVAVEQVLQRLLVLAPDCDGVLFCGQMGGVLLADSRGEPLTNYLSWRDQRTVVCGTASPTGSSEDRGTFFEDIAARLGPAELKAIGNELKPGSLTTLVSWLGEHDQLPANATPLDIGNFVGSRLCRSTPRFEITQAIGLVDLTTLNWRMSAFEKMSLGKLDWPSLTEFREPVGSFAWEGREIPCYPVVGDQQAALAGAFLADGELSLNISTGSQVSRLTRQINSGEFQTRPYFDGWLLDTITHLPAGRSLEALVDLLCELPRSAGQPVNNPWPLIARAAEQASDSDLEVALTFFAGSLGYQGHINHITLGNLTVGHLFRAAFRSMAENYERSAVRLSPERNWSRLVFSGGLANNLPLLRDFIVARLGGAFRMCQSSEDALFGLLVLGLVVSGRAKNVAEATKLAGSQ